LVVFVLSFSDCQRTLILVQPIRSYGRYRTAVPTCQAVWTEVVRWSVRVICNQNSRCPPTRLF